MTLWNRRFFESTRGRIVALLRRKSMTVEEMARKLEVTDNAVRAQLASLERDGLVEQSGVRRGSRKPSQSYGLTSEVEPALSRAYVLLLVELVRELAERHTAAELAALLEAVGRRWASHLPTPVGDIASRMADAAGLLRDLGGDAEFVEEAGQLTIRGYGCPLGRAVQDNPKICAAVESLLTELIGVQVRESCDRTTAAPRCRFVVG